MSLIIRVFSLIIASFSFSAVSMDAKEDLYLVIGSVQENQAFCSQAARLLHDGDDVDCTHEHTWGGKATTFDIKPPKKNIRPSLVGDATSHDFSGFNIVAAFFERLFTFDENQEEYGNLIGASLKNINKSMAAGATIEIELDPCYSFESVSALEKLVSEAELDERRRANPFHGWHHYIMTYDALIDLGISDFDKEKLKAELLTNDFYNEAMVESVLYKRERFLAAINVFAEAMSVSPQRLAQRIHQEMKIYHQLSLHDAHYIVNQMPKIRLASLFAGGARLGFDDFDLSFSDCQFSDVLCNHSGG